MAKIPFDIKYRPQIESGEYKVETRDGVTVKIIYWEAKGPSPIIGLFMADDGCETTTQVHSNGRWSDDESYESDYDLFLITPEPEFTEFEEAVATYLDGKGLIVDAHIQKGAIKTIAAKLLDLARKEIEEELKEKVLHDYWKQASNQCIQARKEGQSEALKDLPRWKKWGNGACGNGQGIPLAIVKRGLNGYELVDALGIPGEQYIMLSDLEKLPGFKED